MSQQDMVNIQNQTVTGISRKLGEAFGTNPARMIQTMDAAKKLVKRLYEERTLQYPLCYFTLSSVGASVGDSYRPHALAKYGRFGRAATDLTEAQRIGLVPVKFTCNFMYITDDFNRVMDFIGRWYFAQFGVGGRLDFQLTYYGCVIPIRMTPQFGADLTVPRMETSDEEPKFWPMEGTLTVDGYVSNIHDDLDTQKVNIIHERTSTANNVLVNGEPTGNPSYSPVNVDLKVGPGE